MPLENEVPCLEGFSGCAVQEVHSTSRRSMMADWSNETSRLFLIYRLTFKGVPLYRRSLPRYVERASDLAESTS